MKPALYICALVVCLECRTGLLLAQSSAASLRGTVTDPSGAVVPGALVQLRGTGPEQRATTDISGHYSFSVLRPGKYTVRAIAKGFTVAQMRDVDLSSPQTLNVQLTIEAEAQVVNVEDEANNVGADPASNGSALVLRGEGTRGSVRRSGRAFSSSCRPWPDLAPDPNGGQIYIDGFTGGNLPAESSIREMRINSNPFSTEYDRPGFGRIEIFTKPGTDSLHGQAFVQYNKESLNSRSPLLTQSHRPPYEQNFFGSTQRTRSRSRRPRSASTSQRRSINENAFIYATILDAI